MAQGQHDKQGTAVKRIVAVSALSLVGGSTPLIAAGSAHAATQAQWDCIAHWESRGRWHLPYGTNDSTGGLQIETRTWDDYNGQQFAPKAYQATEAQQITVAERILAGQGAGAWTTNYHCHLTRGGYVAPPVHKSAVKATPIAGSPAPVKVSGVHYTVKSGDCLWLIALDHYGKGEDWTRIYDANRSLIGGNPDLILPGQVLTLP